MINRLRSVGILGLAALALSVSALTAGVGAAAAQVRRPLPVVQRIEPTSGPPGTAVSLVGRYFDRAQTVHLGDVELEVASRLPNRWTVTIPDGARSGRIEVHTSRGSVRGPRFRVTQAAPLPVITGLSPDHGAAGTEIVIEGEHFSPRASENHVSLGATPVVVQNANPTELRVLVPEGAESGPFRLRVTGAGEASSASFTVEAGMHVTGFEPAFGPPTTRVVLRGTGFDRRRARVRVYLGDQRARVIRASETELTVEVPRRNPRSGRWLVDVRGGSRTYSATSFDVRYMPVISSMDPAFGAPGTRVTLAGDHFGDDVRAVTATIGETTLRVREVTDERLVLEIPAGAETGAISLTVNGMGPVEMDSELRIVPHVSIDGFSPRSGGAGTQVTLLGRGFSTTAAFNSVTLGGQACEVVSSTEEALVVRIPEASSGPLMVSVENAGEARTRQPFVVTNAPTITSVTPMSGVPGAELTITGTNFGDRAGLIRVRIGDRLMELRRSSPTELVVAVPAGATSAPIRVVVRLQGTVTTRQPFVVQSP